MKKIICLFVSTCLILSLFGSMVCAEVRTDSTYLYRGGSSVVFQTPAQKWTDYGVSWCSNLTWISCYGMGFPDGEIGGNRIVSRMRTNETEASASYTVTHYYGNYTKNGDNRVWQSWYSGYGSLWEYYKLATSMSSASTHNSCHVTYRWNP